MALIKLRDTDYYQEYKKVREIAGAYYAGASEEEKNSAKEFFRTLDANGDGKVSLAEFKASAGSWYGTDGLFERLDENGDGSLDFDEALVLHYMKKAKILKCNRCRSFLVDAYFSCLTCHSRARDTYDLCCACYRGGEFVHIHPTTDFLDHHSLLKLFRYDRTAEKQKNQGKKKMEELHEIAKAHYRAGSPQVQELAYEFYRSMDSDGDGRVNLSEFLAFMWQEGHSYMRNPNYFFNELDLDGNGTLDFYEVMTLYYIIKSGRPFCDGCGHFIPGIFFSCVDCFKSPRTSFHLCWDCYRNAKCRHNHDGRTQFLDNYTLLQTKRDLVLAQASGVYSNEALNVPTNAIVPAVVHHNSHTSYNNNTYMVHPPTNAIVPATPPNRNNWRIALKAFELALNIGSISGTLCTIM